MITHLQYEGNIFQRQIAVNEIDLFYGNFPFIFILMQAVFAPT